MFSNDFNFYLKNQNRVIQNIKDNPKIMFSKISLKFINFPKKNPEIIDLVKSHELKDLIIKSNKKKLCLKKKLNNYPRYKSNNSFNLSYSKIFSLSSIKPKQNIELNDKINKMKIKNIRPIILFPNKDVPLKNSMNLKRRNIINEYDKNEKEEKQSIDLLNIKTRDKNEKKEQNNISIIKHEIKHLSMNSSPKNVKFRNIKIISKSKSEICCIQKKIPLKLGNDTLNLLKLEDVIKSINKTYIPFPLIKNINNQTNTFYYTINQMYYNQISNYFKHRINWVLIQNRNNQNYYNANFQWKYYSNRFSFKRFVYHKNCSMKKIKMTNLFERNYELGNKKHFFINLIKYCDQCQINVFEIIPFTIIFSHNKTNFDEQFKIFNNVYDIIKDNLKSEKNLIFNKLYSEVFNYDKNFLELKYTPLYIEKEFLSEYNYWIIKPSDLYQGMCIEINNNMKDIFKICKKMFQGVDKRLLIDNIDEPNNENNEKLDDEENKENEINEKNENKENQEDEKNENENKENKENENNENIQPKKYSTMHCSNDIIIQKYLDKPFLYNNRKFDIRCFVLVDSNFNVYYCREGHLKGSSEIYNLNNTNKFIHITNHSVQKKCNKFEKYEYGNEISYNDFKDYLLNQNISLDKFEKLMLDIKDLILISMNSVKNKLMRTNNVLCFEIFGYDFIIDNNFKPWILEINNNPGLAISSPLIEKLIPRMLDDAFRLTIDKVFETKYDSSCIKDGKYCSKYKLDNFSDEENIFEFLCNMNL